MTIPTEVFVWMLGAILAVMSFGVHVVISIKSDLGKICTAHAVAEAKVTAEIAAIHRHATRNTQEIEVLQKHLRISSPQRREGEQTR